CHPGAVEACDGRDNDCDGSVDDGAATTFYADMDGDGFGVAGAEMVACTAPAGYAPRAGDCDDACVTCNPEALEICDTRDNDCDGGADEGVTSTFYRDADRDGFGGAMSVDACVAPAGYVPTAGDCDDAAA